jgi:glycosyltransferase involved in cell wall biosynthesis
MRIAIATDAWYPQPNGVVRVLASVIAGLRMRGHQVLVISPDLFRRSIPCPTYPELPITLWPGAHVREMLARFDADAIHIATEGPIGSAAQRYCLDRKLPFTTAYHTKFPEYLAARTRMPVRWFHAAMRKFHSTSSGVMVPATAVYNELDAYGYANLRQWSHGVDSQLFQPGTKDYLAAEFLPRPIFLYVGRVTIDKNLPAFLALDLPGSKVVIGSGPERIGLMKRYPKALFRIAGETELPRYYNAADVFVFPSRTDTFGLVMLEALACGVPVAAFPVTGPLDVIGASKAGCLNEDLRAAAISALQVSPDVCRARALELSWDRVVDQFLGYLAPIAKTVS